MGVYETSWAAPIFLESMKFWFYSLCASLALGIMELFTLSEPKFVKEKSGGDEKKVNAEMRKGRGEIVRKLVTDGCDLFIPGSVTGWLVLSSANVGWCSVVSTVLASVDIWARVQSQSS